MGTVMYQNERRSQIDSPTAAGAAHLMGALTIAVDQRDPNIIEDDVLVVTLSALCENHALTDNVRGKIAVRLYFSGGNTEVVEVTCDMNPGRGWPWHGPTTRGGNSAATFPRAGHERLVKVEWGFKNIEGKSPAIEAFQYGVQVAIILWG
jgi:hypothetical protein